MLQTVQSSPVDAGAASGVANTVTITFEEDGIARLRDLLFQATVDDVASTAGVDVVPAEIGKIVQATTLTLNGGTEFLRSRGTILGVNPFAHRDRNVFAPRDIEVGSGDTLAFTGTYVRTAVDSVWSMAVPFFPKSQRRGSSDRSAFWRDEVWVPSPNTALTADGTNATITTTFDDHGLIDLSRLIVHASSTAVALVAADYYNESWHNDVPLNVLDIHIRSEGNLINGQGTQSSPNFWRRDRTRNVVNLGVHAVAPGDTLTIIVESNTGTLLSGAAYSGVPMVLRRGKCR